MLAIIEEQPASVELKVARLRGDIRSRHACADRTFRRLSHRLPGLSSSGVGRRGANCGRLIRPTKALRTAV
jgi:hypothetical protein